MTITKIEEQAEKFEKSKEFMESFDYPSWQEICKSDEFVQAFLVEKDLVKANDIANKLLGVTD